MVGSDVRLLFGALESVAEGAPTVHGLVAPDPDGGGDADDHAHEVFDHEHLELGFAMGMAGGGCVDGAGDGVVFVAAGVEVPGLHPLVEVGLFVEEAGDDDEGGDRVEDGEDADPDHELLQFVGSRPVVLHHGSDAEERHEAGEQEGRAQHQVHAQRGEDEAAQRLHVPHAHVAHARQDVA